MLFNKIKNIATKVFFLAFSVLLSQQAHAQNVTYGNGDTQWLRQYVGQLAANQGQPIPAVGNAFYRSYNSSGGGNTWYDTGIQLTPTLVKICNILGFNNYVSSTCADNERSGTYTAGKCNFHSPENNSLIALNGAGTAWQQYPATPKYGNTFLATITCSGPIQTPTVKVTKTGPTTVAPGSNASFNFTVTNTGPVAFNTNQLSDFSINNAGNVITTQLQFVSAVGATCAYGTGELNQVLICTFPGLAPGASRNITLNYFVPLNSTCNSVLMRQSDAHVTAGIKSAADWIKSMYTVNCAKQCSDGIDNDGDGRTDLADSGCSDPNDDTENTPQCSDGKDNDADGLVDFPADPGCSSPTDDTENTPQCSDGKDNDSDGTIDFPADVGCSSPTDDTENTPACSDGKDNDGDGLIDLADPGCSGPNDPTEDTPQCSDGKDNDADGLVDFPADPGCSSPTDDTENTPQCSDGKDNDGDGLIDFPSDPGCSSPTDDTENTPACSDGRDNDGDGLIDLADPGCSGPNDPTEDTPQCSDGKDNDNDGKIDFPSDPGCSSGTDNDETDLPQCSDGRDNDGDGLIDLADPGCSGPNDPTEDTPQCSDGKDNDGDGKTDFPADPGCSSPTDDTENTPQCSDGKDNDGDGAIDFPADFSCSTPTDDDETNPKSQCQDGIDNDGDGKTDFPADTDCSSNQDNTENGNTPQCRDGFDNDNDGAIDFPEDFSCSSADDDDETNPKSQCQDGIDNDGDGKIDLRDDGCTDSQDNDESTVTTNAPQCSDGLDNDKDGAIDFPADFGCSSSQDNDESDPKSQCQDGIDNDGDGLIDFGKDTNCDSNQDNSEAEDLTPYAECIENTSAGVYVARFGYLNSTPATIDLAVGATNGFTPGQQNRGQATKFLVGRITNAFQVSFDGSNLTWKLGNLTVTANASTVSCTPSGPIENKCVDTDITGTLVSLDSGIQAQQKEIDRAARKLLKISNTAANKKYVATLSRQVSELYKLGWNTTWTIPRLITSCANLTQCFQADNLNTVVKFNQYSQSMVDLSNQLAKRIKKLKTAEAAKISKSLLTRVKGQHRENIKQSAQVPRFDDQC